MAYKIINKLSPENIWGIFQQRSSQSNYATRHCKDLQIPRVSTEHVKKSYQYSTVKIWNTIPTDIRELPVISKGVPKELIKNMLGHLETRPPGRTAS